MQLAQVVAELVKALADLAAEAVQAYIEGDPSKLDRVQSVLPVGIRLRSEAVQALERERTRRALGG